MQLSGSLRAVISQTLLPRKSGGRVAAREIMVLNQAISSLIREGKSHQLYGQLQTGSADGMITLEMDVARLLTRDIITFESALSAVNDVKTFMTIIERVSTAPPKQQPQAAPGAKAPQKPQAQPAPRGKDSKGGWWK